MLKRKPNNSKPARRLPPPSSKPPPAAERPPSGRRRWIFRLIALIAVPLLLLGALEGALRLAGYGYPTGLFEEITLGGRTYLVGNEQFSRRFFPPQLERWPTAIRMEVPKPAGTYRIFILGESAAQGDPEPAFGAGRYLEALLNARFPREHFEVVNLAITAINSNVILPIARDCARQQGDLWILYIGNNEMVGPFGAATVFGAKAPPLWAIRLSLAVETTRVGQWIQSLIFRLKGRSAEPSWGGMQMFLGNQVRPDDPRRDVVDSNFQHNLRDIVRVGLGSGARILLSTVAVNLKDCPPFASLSNSNLPPADQVGRDGWLDRGAAAERAGDYAAAADAFARAAGLDPELAGAQYSWAEVLLQLTNMTAAADHFQRACDDDALPFRADSRINGAIREVARQLAAPNLTFFDARAALAANGAPEIPGQETFYEHVHFNFDGNYRLGRAWADEVRRLLPPSITAGEAPDWATQEQCENRLGLTDWNRVLVWKSVLQRFRAPPLSGQSNNRRREQVMEDQIAELSRKLTPEAAVEASNVLWRAIQRSPDDHFLHENFAEFLQSIGDYSQATAQWEQVRELLPQDCLAYFQRGRLLELQNQLAEAQVSLEKAVALRPSLVEAWSELGNVYFARADYPAALRTYERARALRPNNPQTWFNLGRTLSLLNRPDESLRSFEQAIRLDPVYWEAHNALAGELGLTGRIEDAGREFEEVIRLRPDFAPAHLNLGVALMKQGRLADAAREYQAALRLNPDDRLAREYLAKCRAAMGALENRGGASGRP